MNSNAKEWACKICTFINADDQLNCSDCGNPKPEEKNLIVIPEEELKMENKKSMRPVLLLEIFKGKLRMLQICFLMTSQNRQKHIDELFDL